VSVILFYTVSLESCRGTALGRNELPNQYPIKREMENNGSIHMERDVTKFYVSWVTRQVVEVGLGYAVNSWNSHPIPGNSSLNLLRLIR